jgi:ribosomal protein S18 acetylase RimI-like enzyme
MIVAHSLRRATADDVDFLWAMLYEASHAAENDVPDEAVLRRHPELARYVEGWGGHTDLGVVAVDDDTGERVGAAWLRLLTGDTKGYGYVDDDTPELVIAVLPGHRGRGLGGRLLRALLDAATGVFGAVSLSVQADNPALRLYERTGFRIVEGTDDGPSLTMRTELAATGRSRRRC